MRASIQVSGGLVVMFRYWSLNLDLFNDLEWIVSRVFYFSASENFCKLIAELESALNKGGYFPIDLFTMMFPCRRVLPSHVLWNVSLSPIFSFERRYIPTSTASSLRREKVVSARLLLTNP